MINLHIYQKPRIGDNFITHYRAENYSHKISAMGGFDTASCTLNVSDDTAQTVFWEYVGNRVAVYGNNPVLPIWEGLINSVTLETGVVKISRSLEEMSNRIVVQYADDTATERIQRTAAVTNPTSFLEYGYKSTAYDIGEQYTNGGGIATAVRDRLINDVSLPVVSASANIGGRSSVTIEMIGMYHTLAWDTETVTDTTSRTEQEVIELFISSNGVLSYAGRNSSRYGANGDGIFFNDTDHTWQDNLPTSAFNRTNEMDLGETIWDTVREIVEAGNNGDRMIAGVTRTLINEGYRRFYYELANTDVEYTTDAYGNGDIYTIQGNYVPPQEVLPNRKIRIKTGLIEVSAEFYITQIDYDAERDEVTWASDGNTDLPSIFALNAGAVSTRKRFGHVRPIAWGR